MNNSSDGAYSINASANSRWRSITGSPSSNVYGQYPAALRRPGGIPLPTDPGPVNGWVSVLRRLRTRTDARSRVLVLGTGELADDILHKLQNGAGAKYHAVSCFDMHHWDNVNAGNGYTTGDHIELKEVLERERVDCIVVAMGERRGRLPIDLLLSWKFNGMRVEEGAAFFEKISGKIHVVRLNPSFLIFNDGFRWPTKTAKRLTDLFFSTLCLILAAPLFCLLPLLIKLTSPGPAFFQQTRVGLHGRRFTMLKFRTMVVNAEENGDPVWASEQDPRATRFGAFMRKFRLDELPQLINVFCGAMSFIGPRPERPEFVKSLSEQIPYYDLRHTVKPGISGWAQVNFRYGASVMDAVEKLQYDLYYIKHMSIALDWRIVFKTVRIVINGFGGR
jgi:sugar transferase (PEP-CTERM system associated)